VDEINSYQNYNVPILRDYTELNRGTMGRRSPQTTYLVIS